MVAIKYRVPFFDLDWTLIVGGSRIHRQAFLWAIKKVFDIEAKIDINIQGMVDSQILYLLAQGTGVDKQRIQKSMPELIGMTDEYFITHFEEEKFKPMPGAESLLQALFKKGIPVGILTGNTRVIGQAKLKKIGLWDYIQYSVYGDEHQERNKMVELACTRVREKDGSINIRDLVIVGDTPKDIECALRTKALSLAVATGKYSRRDLNDANLVIDSLKETNRIIDFLKYTP